MTIKKTGISLAFLSILGVGFSGCTTTVGTANIDKTYFKDSKSLDVKEYQTMGTVSYNYDAWLASSCSSMGQESLLRLKTRADTSGADGIMDVRWEGKDGELLQYPLCRTAWGWLLLWPAWFVPGTSSTTATGVMIKYKNLNNPTTSISIVDEIVKLNDLVEKKAITKEEYEQAKQKLLAK
jgi:hypothetical protein